MNLKIPYITGSVSFQSTMELEQVGQILSKKIFGGLIFGGRDLDIYDEIPAIFIQSKILGLQIVLQEYDRFEKFYSYNLSIHPWVGFEGVEDVEFNLSTYLVELFKVELNEFGNIIVLNE